MAIRKFLPGLALALALSVSAPAYAHEAHEKAAAAKASWSGESGWKTMGRATRVLEAVRT